MVHLLRRRLPGWIVSGALVSILLGCGEAPPKEAPLSPDTDIAALKADAELRLLEMTEPYGWVVSRWSDGRIEHTGDSLLWTGMAMGVLDCERGSVPEKALLDMLEETGGYAYRHPREAARKPSLDGHLGLYWGIAHRVSRCPASAQVWRRALTTHKPVNVNALFTKVLDSVKFQLGLATSPKGTATLTDSIAAWAYGVVLTKASGYRIHLGFLSLETLEATGAGLPASARSKFCSATTGATMATVDHWCGRGDLPAFIQGFQPNAWEYAPQRASWESPDGKPGLETPGLDLIVALATAYKL